MLSILLSFTAASRWKIKEEEGKSCLTKDDCGLLFENLNCGAIIPCILPMTILYQPFSSEYFLPEVPIQISVRNCCNEL